MVHARIQRGVVGTAIALHLLRDHRAVVVCAGGELVLVERGRVQPIRLQKTVRGAAAIVDRGRRIELGRALILRANGGQVLLLHPQGTRSAHEPELAVEPLLLLLLEHQVDDTGAGVRVELGRRIVDDLDALERRRRQIVQSVLRAEAGEGGLLAIDQHHHLVAAAHLHLAVLPDRHARHGGHRLQHRAARLGDVVGDGERFLVHRTGHRVGVGRDAHIAEGTGLCDQQDGAEVEEGTEFADQDPLADGLVADRPHHEHVGALLEPRERERALLVREASAYERAVSFRLQLQREEREGGLGVGVLHFAEQRHAGGGRLAERHLRTGARQQHQRKESTAHGRRDDVPV